MTDDRHTEPFQALDGLEARDDWDAITARAADPAIPSLPPAPGRPGRRVLAAAAVIVALVAGAVGVASLRDDGSDGDDGRVTAGPVANDPASMFGRRWTAIAVEVDGRPQPVHAAGGLVLTFEGRRATFTPSFGCPFTFEGPLDEDRWKPSYVDVPCSISFATESRWWLTRIDPDRHRENGEPQDVVIAVDDETLTLAYDDIRMTFEESEGPMGLAGTTWTATGFSEGGVERPVLPTRRGGAPTLRFLALDGQLSDGLGLPGFAGCNAYHAASPSLGSVDPPVSVSAAGLIVDTFFHDLGPCTESLGAQESWMLAFLEDDPLVVLRGDRLVLWTDTVRTEWTAASPEGGDGELDGSASTVPGSQNDLSTTTTANTEPTTTTMSFEGRGEPIVPPGRDPNDSDPGEWHLTRDEHPTGLWAVSSAAEGWDAIPATPGWAGGPVFVDFGVDREIRVFGCEIRAVAVEWGDLGGTGGSFASPGRPCPDGVSGGERAVLDVLAGPFDLGTASAADGEVETAIVSGRAGVTVNLRPAVITRAQLRCGNAGGIVVEVTVRGVVGQQGTVELRGASGSVVSRFARAPAAGGQVTLTPSAAAEPPATAIVRAGGTSPLDGTPVGVARVTPLPEGSVCR